MFAEFNGMKIRLQQIFQKLKKIRYTLSLLS